VERGRVSASISALAKVGLLARAGEGSSTRYAQTARGAEYLREKSALFENSENDEESERTSGDEEIDDGSGREEDGGDDDPPGLVPDDAVPEAERQSHYRVPMRLNAARWLDEPAPEEPRELRVAPTPSRALLPEGVTRDQYRSRRHHPVRAKTESMDRFSKTRLRVIGEEFSEDTSVDRPRVRADCEEVARPCPYVGCRHNLFLDVGKKTGAIKYNFPDREPEDMPADQSCALDVVEYHPGGVSLEVVGDLMNLTRERTRQIEDMYWPRLAAGLAHLREDLQTA
jgi:hypothetical protein